MTNKKFNVNQLASLALLYGSIIIGWIAYYNYQPRLLREFRLNDLIEELFVAQGVLMFLTPILAGWLGDKFRKTKGHRLPVISSGVTLASMVFMTVAFTLLSGAKDTIATVLPFMIIIWIFSMALFTSPAVSSIELYVPESKLPRATAILTLVFGLLYAIEPIIIDLIDMLTAPGTFAFGGVAVGLSGYLLHKTSKGVYDKVGNSNPSNHRNDFLTVFVFGVGFGCVLTVIMNLVPERVEDLSFLDITGDFGATIFLGISAVVALPVGYLITGNNAYKVFLWSFFLGGLSLLMFFEIDYLMVWAIAGLVSILSFTAMSVSSLPLVVSKITSSRRVLGVGVFYAGVEFPNGLLEAYLVIYT